MSGARAWLVLGILLAAAPAFAACGDGAVQAGEQCDPTANGGLAVCLGLGLDCVPPDLPNACSCARPATDGSRYVIVAGSKLRFGAKGIVGLGHLAVTEVGGFAQIGRDASIAAGSQVVADQARVLNGAQLGRLFANTAFVHVGATLTAGGPFQVTLPLALAGAPPTPPGAGGDVLPVEVAAGEIRVLAPGAYDAVVVGPSARLILHGLLPGAGAGVYVVRNLLLMPGASLLADNPVKVFIAERLAFSGGGLSGGAFIGPSGPAHVIAGDVQLIAAGGVRLSHSAVASAHITAPSIKVGANTVFTGRLVGDKISISRNAAFFLQGGCGDGVLDPDEQCDTSAPNGTAACPGTCRALGQPGQCSCPCSATAQCDDGNACNGHETCQGTVCVLGIPPDCNDHNPCTRDCDAAIGCVNAPVTNGTGCNDGNPCTGGDSCQAGSCTPGAPVLNGTSCSDQNKCTIADSCQSGACTPGPQRECADDNTCSIDTCDPVAGCQHTLLEDGDPCNDHNVCTLLDHCQDGTCVPGDARNCDDGNPCTAESCDATNGCLHTALPDGTSCPGAKTCQGGFCS